MDRIWIDVQSVKFDPRTPLQKIIQNSHHLGWSPKPIEDFAIPMIVEEHRLHQKPPEFSVK